MSNSKTYCVTIRQSDGYKVRNVFTSLREAKALYTVYKGLVLKNKGLWAKLEVKKPTEYGLEWMALAAVGYLE